MMNKFTEVATDAMMQELEAYKVQDLIYCTITTLLLLLLRVLLLLFAISTITSKK